jgi:DNA-binding transcriptional LysR family regulator
MDLLEKMATYVRVVEAGSLSAAAKQLRISPAAVSRQVAALERELRAPLLRRTTRRMSVTPAGRSYYERALRVLREVDDAQAIGRTAATAGLLSVSAPVTFGLACVVPQLSSFMTAHPGMRLELRLEDRPIDLALEGIDLAVRVGGAPPDSTDVIAHELMSFRRVLVAAPSYLKSHGTPGTPEALAKHDALAGAVDSWTLVGGERESRVRLNVVFRSNAPSALRMLAVDGRGVAMLPEWFVEDEIERGALRVVLRGWETEPVPVRGLHRREHRGSAGVRALLEHLRAAYT